MEEHLNAAASMHSLQQAAMEAARQGEMAQHAEAVYHAHQQERAQAMGMHEPGLQGDEGLELAEGAETKRCAACRIVKPVSEYYKDRTHSRGIKTRCKACLRLCKEVFKNQQRAKSAAEQVTVESKKCSHCGLEKAAADFSRSSYQRTGLRSWCKECSSKSKKEAKAEGRWKSYDIKGKPRKCRKCEEMRDASEFPVDPLHTSKRTRDCQYCIQEAGGHPGMAAPLDAGTGMGVAVGGHSMPMGAWGAHLGDYWMDPAARAQQQAMAAAEQSFQQQHQVPAPHNESLMRILRAAMTGNGEEPRRMTPELLSQLGVYADPNDPFSELPPESQAAVIQQFVEQQQHNAMVQGHPAGLQAHAAPGFTHEALFQTARDEREGGSGINFPPGQRPPEGHGHHMLPYAELLQHARQEEAPQHQPEEQAEAKEAHPSFGQGLGMSFEQLRNLPYTSGLGGDGWQGAAGGSLSQSLGMGMSHQLHHPQPHSLVQPSSHGASYGHLLHDRAFPSAFAPAHRLLSQDGAQHSPKRHKPDQD